MLDGIIPVLGGPAMKQGRSNKKTRRHHVDWVTPRPMEEALAFLGQVSSIYSKSGLLSAELHSLVDEGKLLEVVNYRIPTDIDVNDYRGARQIQALFSKQCWIDLGLDPLHEGVKAFIKAEEHCVKTNERFLSEERGDPRVCAVLAVAREKLRQLFGSVPSLQALNPRYGPGANTRVKMAQASLSGKLSAKLACSENMFPFVDRYLAEMPYLAEHHSLKDKRCFPLWVDDPDLAVRHKVVVHVDLGNLCFVPKSAKTHRPIIVEPPLNGFWQLSVGAYLKDRLRLFSVDLTDQNRNRSLARIGSEGGGLATLDLSSASDTISWAVVADLIPPEWLEFLEQLRTGSIFYDGSAYRLEKFSSMGNGFTFELESAIFWALAYGCVFCEKEDVSNIGIFGDDIIVPERTVPLLLETLDWCGFLVNPDKSFWSGKFRESCGADWLDGQDVRPFYVRDEISDRTLYIIHNWAMRRGERELASLAEAWTWKALRLYGPDGYGDGHLLGSHSLYSRREDRRRGWCGGYFDTYSQRPKRSKNRGLGDWLLPTYSVYVRSGAELETDPYLIRGGDGYVRTPVYTQTTSIFCG
jgi:hypothetical protein